MYHVDHNPKYQIALQSLTDRAESLIAAGIPRKILGQALFDLAEWYDDARHQTPITIHPDRPEGESE